MHSESVLRVMASEIPILIRQIESDDPVLVAAGLQRLRDFAGMTAIWRAGRTVSRRGLLRGAGATFAALSLKVDD